MRERTPFYALLVLAAAVGAFAEPLYDVAMMLYFYSTEGMWTHFTAFDIPQPIWTHSGYVVLYAAPAIYIAHQIARGTMTRSKLFVWAGITLLESAAFEIDRHQRRPLQLLGATCVPDLPVPVGDWCARSRSGDLLRGGRIAAACPLHRSVATAGPVRAVSMHVLHGQLRRRLAHHHRNPPRAHLDSGDCGGNGGEHRLRGGSGAGGRVVPAAGSSRRCRGPSGSRGSGEAGHAATACKEASNGPSMSDPRPPIFATPSSSLPAPWRWC